MCAPTYKCFGDNIYKLYQHYNNAMPEFFTVAVPRSARKRLRFLAGAHELTAGQMVAALIDEHDCLLEHQFNELEVENE
jgi:hypothetical protein